MLKTHVYKLSFVYKKIFLSHFVTLLCKHRKCAITLLFSTFSNGFTDICYKVTNFWNKIRIGKGKGKRRQPCTANNMAVRNIVAIYSERGCRRRLFCHTAASQLLLGIVLSKIQKMVPSVHFSSSLALSTFFFTNIISTGLLPATAPSSRLTMRPLEF